MSVKVQTSLRIDQTSLQDDKKILEEMGMNFSEAVNIFTKMIVSRRRLPFEVTLPNNRGVWVVFVLGFTLSYCLSLLNVLKNVMHQQTL